jgi:hypothetical protein
MAWIYTEGQKFEFGKERKGKGIRNGKGKKKE